MLRYFIRKPDQLTYRSPTLDIIHHRVKDESQVDEEHKQLDDHLWEEAQQC